MKKVVHIAFCTNSQYVPYVGVAIKSLIMNSSKDIIYKIHILHAGIAFYQQGELEFVCNCVSNIELNFIDVSSYFDKHASMYVSGRQSVAAYWRFFLPECLSDVDKVIYLDGDLIVLDDLSKLYDENIEGYALGVCLDWGVVYSNNKTHSNSEREYMESLGLKDYRKYVNSGVMLINLDVWREEKIGDKLISVATEHKFALHDQDAINVLLGERIKLINCKWNFLIPSKRDLYPIGIERLLESMIREFKFSIIHYAGKNKPWLDDCCLLRSVWVVIARNTPFFAGDLLNPMSQVEISIYQRKLKRFGQKLEKFLIPDIVHRVKRMLKAGNKREDKK